MGSKSKGLKGRQASARVLWAEVDFAPQAFVRPLILSTGAIHTITQATATVCVEVDGREAQGHGCIYLSDLWAWPSPQWDHAQRDAAMQRYARRVATQLPHWTGEPAHPLALGLRLHEAVLRDESPWEDGPVPPAMARLVCASPFDAAIHDAVGQALQISAFELYEPGLPIPEADGMFRNGVSAAIAAMLLHPPRTHSPAWWVAGKADDLERDLRPVVEQRGYFAFKLKIMGQDASQDAARTAEVAQALRRWGVERPRLSIDSNEANPDAQSVLDYLDELERLDPQAYAALEMIEQPTARDIAAHRFDWRPVAQRKPVMVDEGLIGLESLKIAQEQGWSGFALKTCKGHSFALMAAAWAHEQGMLLSLQDLTNPGLSAVHAGLFAAHVPTINGVELNSPQFTPAANADWDQRLPELFAPRQGQHRLPPADAAGLGSHLGQPIPTRTGRVG